jgi:hypothetical protein
VGFRARADGGRRGLDKRGAVREVSETMSAHKPPDQGPEGSFLSTLGWVGAVLALAVLALVVLSALGPVGEH